MPCDIAVRADCERAIAATMEKFGALHVLVNNAGKGMGNLERSPHTKSLKFWESDPDVWCDVLATNVNGTFLMARTATPHLIRAGGGRIVNITTSLPTMQRRHNSPYGVTKAAIEAETLIWAQDLAGSGVTVNSLIPGGAADTDFVHQASRVELRCGRPDIAAAGRDGATAPLARVAAFRWRDRRALRRQALGRASAAERSSG